MLKRIRFSLPSVAGDGPTGLQIQIEGFDFISEGTSSLLPPSSSSPSANILIAYCKI